MLKIKYLSYGLFFTLLFISIWAWMLGFFAMPESLEAPQNIYQWVSPGVLSFPALASLIPLGVALQFFAKFLKINRKSR
ncbi:hypothetical protein [Pseudoalteromonas galatheae]|uniref:hypothetical protein n=1 Tax=Pseudoalteromonas galatheae TaxID=579562 RepID=UPI0030D2C73B